MGESKYNIHILTMFDACTTCPDTNCQLQELHQPIQHEFTVLLSSSYQSQPWHGTEFIGEEFQELLTSYNIKSKPTTVKNPMAQALVECLHLTLGK